MPNNKNLTRADLIQYYIDVLGYSEEDLKNTTFGELAGDLNDAQLMDCLQYNNKN